MTRDEFHEVKFAFNEETTALIASDSTPPDEKKPRRSRRRKTAHLKMVPQTRELRDSLRERCRVVANTLGRNVAPSKDELESLSRQILSDAGLEEGYLGWTMVVFSSVFWEPQIESIPHSRRLFLLPHCLKHAEGCPADYDEFGLACKTCGACSIADFRSTAEELGYKVLVAEGSPIVLKIIVSGHVDAIVGVACLNVLEKAIDKIMLAGIPCMAVPLLSSDCRNTSVDEEWVDQMIRVPHQDVVTETRTWMHLMRKSSQLFEPAMLDRIAPRLRGPRDGASDDNNLMDPIRATESMAYDFLSAGGKYSRPFITLSVYDAVRGGDATTAEGPKLIEEYPDSILRTAMAIETFHKASLVHDDIEDSDDFRYGDETLHHRYGVPTAINVGDYLIGMGYRLVSRDRKELGAETAADILDHLASAHQRLAEGQGAEIFWRDARDKCLKPIDALKIYALKTAPAFEAAFYSGLRLAGPTDAYDEIVRGYCRNLGVAFQILNDLKDWDHDHENKCVVGSDLLGGRPTILLALALEKLSAANREELLSLMSDDCPLPEQARIDRARHLYFEANVFQMADRLVEKHRSKAEQFTETVESEPLRRLMVYLTETMLDRVAEVKPTIEIGNLTYESALPIVSDSPVAEPAR